MLFSISLLLLLLSNKTFSKIVIQHIDIVTHKPVGEGGICCSNKGQGLSTASANKSENSWRNNGLTDTVLKPSPLLLL